MQKGDYKQLGECYKLILENEVPPTQPNPPAPEENSMYEQILDEFYAFQQAAERCAGMYDRRAPLNMSGNILPQLKKIHMFLSNIAEHIEGVD